jgi:hypothetical protein
MTESTRAQPWNTGKQWPPWILSYPERFSSAGLENDCNHMARGPCDLLQEGGDVTNTGWLKTLLITKESEGALYYEEARSIWRANF